MRRRWGKSLLMVMLVLSIFGVLTQGVLAFMVSSRSMRDLEGSVIEAKSAEMNAFSKMMAEDIDALMIQLNYLSNSASLQRLKLSLNEPAHTIRYVQDSQYIWEELSAKSGFFEYTDSITLYVRPANRKITSESILPIGEAERAWLQALLQNVGNRNIVLQGGKLYLHSSEIASDDDTRMQIMWVATCTERTLRQYLRRYQAGGAQSDFALAWADETGIIPLACLNDEALCGRVLAQLPLDGDEGSLRYADGDDRVVATWARVGGANLRLVQITAWDGLAEKISGYQQLSLFANIAILGISIVLMALLYGTVSRPLRRLRGGLQTMRAGNLDIRLGHTWAKEYQEVFSQFDEMADRIQTRVEKDYQARLVHAQAELKQLQYQISPHFLYNTYFTLCSLLQGEEYEQAERFAELLGQFLRYITVSDQSEARLKEELAHASAYARIQGVRFGNRVTVSLDECPPELEELRVPRMVVQPLIENAFEHGVKSMPQRGEVRTRIRYDAREVWITVEDNGNGVSDEQLSGIRAMIEPHAVADERDSVALYNINRRIRVFYGEECGLSIERSALGGLAVSVRIRREKGHA